MQRQRQLAGFRRVAFIDRGGDGMQEVRADAALFVAQFDLARGVLHGLSDRRALLSLGNPGRARACRIEGKEIGAVERNRTSTG